MSSPRSPLLDRLGIRLPIIQAPMAGVATPAMAAAVTEAGGLGSLSVGSIGIEGARAAIAAVRKLTRGPVNINVFCHAPPKRDVELETAWIDRFRPQFEALGAQPPSGLREIYRSFGHDPAMEALLLQERPEVVSFQFGLPRRDWIGALKARGALLLASATSLAEARAAAAAGVDAVVAQGWEAGGHRGIFDPDAPDERLGTQALTRRLVQALDIPVIAAGGIMDGAGIAAVLSWGAAAAQLGTAFIACPESAADPGYRAALASEAARDTTMTRAISGRPARCLANLFTRLTFDAPPEAVPSYPVAYDLGKALHAAARARGVYGFGAQWAGEGAPFSRPLPAGELVATLAAELEAELPEDGRRR